MAACFAAGWLGAHPEENRTLPGREESAEIEPGPARRRAADSGPQKTVAPRAEPSSGSCPPGISCAGLFALNSRLSLFAALPFRSINGCTEFHKDDTSC